MLRVLAVLAVATLAAAQLTAEEKEELAALLEKSSGDDVSEALKLDDAQKPHIRANDGNVEARTLSRVRLDSHAGNSVFDLSKRLDALENAMDVKTLDSVIGKSIGDAMKANQQITTVLEKVTDIKSALKADYVPVKDLESFKKELLSTVTTTLSKTSDEVEKSVDEVSKSSKATQDKLTKTVSDLTTSVASDIKKAKEDLTKSVNEQLKGTSTIMASLRRTYHVNGKIPVFRWAKWETYNNCGTSWFDSNSGDGYGGVNPSRWSDGNAYAAQMANDFKYLRRLFHRHGTADQFGATVCSDNFIMHSSTNGLHCGVLFRIINKGTSSITWRPNWRYTSYSGWNDYASVSLNGANNFYNGGCHGSNGGCTTTPNLQIPANSQKNRVSTVIFISSGSNNYGWGAFNWRSNLNQFRNNALNLPSGLEYVDDLDSVTGGWKQ